MEDIKKLKSELQTYASKNYNTTSTQTVINVRNASTTTEPRIKNSACETEDTSYPAEPSPKAISTFETKDNTRQKVDSSLTHDKACGSIKSRVLILGDKYCRNLHSTLKRLLGSNVDNYSITSILKPGAPLHNIIDNIESLVKNFTFRDHIILIGGSEDFLINKTPSLKILLNKLKACVHTNVMILSIPFQKRQTYLNVKINKFNIKLCEFINKFSRYTEGKVLYIDINSMYGEKYTNRNISKHILSALTVKTIQSHNLIFVQTDNQFTTVTKRARETENNKTTDLNKTSKLQRLNIAKSKSTSHNNGIAEIINSRSFLGPVTNSIIQVN